MIPINLCLVPFFQANITTKTCDKRYIDTYNSDCLTGYFLSNIGNTIENNSTSYAAVGLYPKMQNVCLYDKLAEKKAVKVCEKRTCLHGGRCIETDGRIR